MSNYSQITGQGVENMKCEDFFEGMSNESRELLKRALEENMDFKIRKIEEEAKDIELPEPSRRHKILMNRLFRERVGGSFLPFPEENSLYERVRSKLVIKLKINEFLDSREKRRRRK